MNNQRITVNELIEKYFSLNIFFQSVFWFALILIVKYDTLLAPPVWDAAMGVFPPAIFLYENSFDIRSLIQKPDWWLGGMNVHSFSLWTWVIALTMSLTKSPVATYISLHLLTFFLSALALSTFVKCMDRYKVNRILSIITGILLISIPVVLVQIGYIYNEILVMCFSIFAFYALQNNKEWLAVAFALIALSIKPTGIAIVASIALVLLFRFLATPNQSRFWKLFFIAVFYIFLTSIYFWLGGIEHTHGLSWGEVDKIFGSLWRRVSSIPEISILLSIGLICGLTVLILPRRLLTKLTTEEFSGRYGKACSSLLIPASLLAVFFTSIIIATSLGYLFLPRYIIPMIPFALMSIVLIARVLNLQTAMCVLFVIAGAVNVFNHNGILYKHSTSFGIVERSHAYKKYSLHHQYLIDEISKLPNHIPIYVNRGVGYLMSHPMMGRLKTTKPNIIKFYLPENITKKASDFPKEAYFALSTRSKVHGGRQMRELINELKEHPDREVKKVYIKKFAGIKMTLYHVGIVSGNEPDQSVGHDYGE